METALKNRARRDPSEHGERGGGVGETVVDTLRFDRIISGFEAPRKSH